MKARPLLPALFGCALIGIGIAAGMSFARNNSASAPMSVDLSLGQSQDWIDGICSNYRIFGRKFQPMIDIGPADIAAVEALIHRTTGLEVSVPSFEETAEIFEGARIIAVNRMPGAELFYRNEAGDLLSVFILARPVSQTNQLTDVQETIRDNLTVAWWQGESALFAVVGPSSDADMPALAQSAYLKF